MKSEREKCTNKPTMCSLDSPRTSGRFLGKIKYEYIAETR